MTNNNETKEEKKILGTGLQMLPTDKRDFSHAVVFGALAVDYLPKDDFFSSELLGIKDQGPYDFCAGFAATEISEDQEAVELNPFFTFAAAKRLLGGDAWKAWGLNLRDVCEAGTKVGFLEEEYYPFANRTDLTRDFLANPANWPADLDMLAADHRKASYFAVDGPHDTFDNIRSVMWQNRMEARSVLAGCAWRYSWNNAKGGIIPRTGWENEKGFGHAFKVFGQMWLDDPENPGKKALYLVMVNSWGPKVGDNGIFYFSREVVNREFSPYGAFTFKDLPKSDAKFHNDNGVCVDASVVTKLIKAIMASLNDLLSLFTK